MAYLFTKLIIILAADMDKFEKEKMIKYNDKV